jgi:hypothetical protein
MRGREALCRRALAASHASTMLIFTRAIAEAARGVGCPAAKEHAVSDFTIRYPLPL